MKFTDREITILRRAVSWYVSTGADGMSSEAWKVWNALLAEDLRRANKVVHHCTGEDCCGTPEPASYLSGD